MGHRTRLWNLGKTGQFTDVTYEIWQAAQQFSLACIRRPENGGLVEKYLFPLLAVGKPLAKPRLSKESLVLLVTYQ